MSSPSSSSSSYITEDRGHSQDILRSFYILKEQKILTDITIKSGNTIVDAHRVVLTAGSPYFRACFTSHGVFVESNDNNKILILDHISEVDAIINYIYTGKIDIIDTNYLSLLDSANQLELPKLVNLCGDFLLSRLDIDNCISIHYLAETYACVALASYAEQFIYRNFEHIISTDEFLNLAIERVLGYIGSDELSVSKEENVFDAIVRWINHDVNNRKQYVDNLIGKVRLELVSPQFIAQSVHQYEHVKGNNNALKYVLDSYQWHCLPDDLRSSPIKDHLRIKAIRPSIYIFGGDDGHNDAQPYGTCMYLDTLLDEWVTASPMLRPRSVCGSAVIGNRIFAVGGYDGDRATDSVEAFDCTTNKWSFMPPLLQRRCSCNCAVLQGKIFVVGGVCGPNAIDQVECFDPVTEQWSLIPPLLAGKSACGVASFQNTYLMVAGGINSQGDTVASSQIFSIETGKWRETASLCCPRRSFALCHWDGLLYAIGGNDGNSDLWTVEIYDPKLNQWKLGSDMTSCRMYCSATMFNNSIYAVGGMSGSKTLQTMERYGVDGRWEQVTPLPKGICGCSIQVSNSLTKGSLQNSFNSEFAFSSYSNGLQELSTPLPTPPEIAVVENVSITPISTNVQVPVQNRSHRFQDLDESKSV